MTISPVSSGSYVPPAQIQPQAGAERIADVENDNDADDVATTKAASPAPSATVNEVGQTIGSVVNVTA